MVPISDRPTARSHVDSLAEACVDLGAGRSFSLLAYQASREAMTEEFERRMPGMTEFVRDWMAARGDARQWRPGVTAKSYFLQEPEGLSRAAKVRWCRVRGDVAVTSLQHDGVVMVLPEGMTVAQCTQALSLACGTVLGYEQPVEEKPPEDGLGAYDVA